MRIWKAVLAALAAAAFIGTPLAAAQTWQRPVLAFDSFYCDTIQPIQQLAAAVAEASDQERPEVIRETQASLIRGRQCHRASAEEPLFVVHNSTMNVSGRRAYTFMRLSVLGHPPSGERPWEERVGETVNVDLATLRDAYFLVAVLPPGYEFSSLSDQ